MNVKCVPVLEFFESGLNIRLGSDAVCVYTALMCLYDDLDKVTDDQLRASLIELTGFSAQQLDAAIARLIDEDLLSHTLQ